ncbi:MAG TPA: hypothetical protein VFC47_09800 [Caulobacteraceae bacterium]|nr:hypothetical protein [Caulobacteraceae bacterium]
MSDISADIREQEARIRQLSNDAMLKVLETLKRDQEIRHAPFTLLAAGLTGGAALLGVALALFKFLTH